MGIQDDLKNAAKGLGDKLGDLAKEKGNEIVADLKGKLQNEVDGLKNKAAKAAGDFVDEQKQKIAGKASEIFGKK